MGIAHIPCVCAIGVERWKCSERDEEPLGCEGI